MLIETITSIIYTCMEIVLSVQFGAFLMTIGSIIYAPTGNRFGKFCLLFGLFIFTLNNAMINI
ncbi:MAG: hypothetical protein ACFFAE_01690 [Candidatus Hodarchaeota archaeon]